MNRRTCFLVLLLPLLASCWARQPQSAVPRLEQLPARFSAAPGTPDGAVEWWRGLASEELNALMGEAMTENFSLRELYARMSQAHYAALKSGAGQWPTLSANAGAGHTDSKNAKGPDLDQESWSLGLSASYEVDLWGRVRAENARETLLARASGEDAKAAVLSVSGQIAESWLALISNRRQQQLFRQQLELQRDLLQLIFLRFPLAKATALDIYQQQQSIEKLAAALIPLQAREETLRRQLALLLGRATLEEGRPRADRFPALPTLPGVGLPADLLAQRPDILAAGARLAAGEQEVAVARADLLPTLKLTASHTYSSDGVDSLFDNWLRNLAANLVAPLLDGKRRHNEVQRQRAVVEERLAIYGRTVFTAIREVEDALHDEQQYGASLASLKRQLELSERTIREARSRYLNGNSDFLNVLREELNVLQVRQELITTEEKMLFARVRLHKALGGSWMGRYAATAADRLHPIPN